MSKARRRVLEGVNITKSKMLQIKDAHDVLQSGNLDDDFLHFSENLILSWMKPRN